MKQLKLLACVLALGAFALLTGCGGDDNNNNGGTQPTGTNAPANLNSSTVTLTPSDGSGNHSIAIDASGNYNATFNDGTTESGTAAYTPSGDNATLVLSPSNGSGVSTINMTFTSPTDGSYTSDTVGSGTFTVAKTGP